ncbi:MAG TPA: S-layer homology domain-containing protein [Clostridia bacterium]|nr:S-layer homology domain-containing protein [Clostridia bacterium]
MNWDFADIWSIDPAVNNGYPILRALVVVVPDTEPPVWAEGFPKAVDIMTSGVALKAKIDENGTAHYVVLTRGADAPSEAQVKNGQNALGEELAVNLKGFLDLIANIENSVDIAGLAPGTAYDLYVVAEDIAGNLQSIPRKLQFTTKTSESTSPSTGSGGVTTYTISVTAGIGGTITPNTIKVRANASQTFTIIPDKGYEIEDVLVDGKSIGVKTSYTFKKVTGKHTIAATFKKMEEVVAEEVPVMGLPFKDVHENNWFYNSIKYAYEKGLMQGTGPSTFSPAWDTSRAMIVTILHRLEKTPSGLGKIFTDVAEGTWYTEAVAWGAENHIVEGYGGNLFGPDDSITREQMAAILYRYARYAGYDVSQSSALTGFLDAHTTGGWALEAMEWAVGSGLIQGKDGNILDPAGPATRAEVATILQRLIADKAH